ncbi:MAG: hypothetical protein WCB92_06540 [Mycobacterium sp.]
MTTDIGHRPNKKQIGAAGEHYVTAELNRRGGYATPFAGNMPGIDIVAFDTDREHFVTIQVKAKGPGGRWVTTIPRYAHPEYPEYGDSPRPLSNNEFWVLVDLTGESPDYYVFPAQWLETDICAHFQEWLTECGGKRPRNPASRDWSIDLSRVAQWRNRWDVLGIGLTR